VLHNSFPSTAAVSLSIAFGVVAAVHLAGPAFLQRTYERAGFPLKFHRVPGILGLLIAFFLAVSPTRIWGVVMAELVTFAVVVMLLGRERYLWSVPAIALMLALVPAALGPI
jgi:hypothetical protein